MPRQNYALPSYFSQSFFAKSSSQSRSLEEHGGTGAGVACMLLLLLLLQLGETKYLTNSLQKEFDLWLSGWMLLKSYWFSSATWKWHERSKCPYSRPGKKRERENSKYSLTVAVWHEKEMERQFTWDCSLPILLISSTPLQPRRASSLLLDSGPMALFPKSSQRVKHEFQCKNITSTPPFIYYFTFCKRG